MPTEKLTTEELISYIRGECKFIKGFAESIDSQQENTKRQRMLLTRVDNIGSLLNKLEKLIEIEQSKPLEVTPTNDPDLICPVCEVKTKIKGQDRSKSGVTADFICLICSNQFN